MSFVSAARNRLGRAKGYSGCGRCGGTWDYTEGHTTRYEDVEDGGAGCFPLCEVCWVGLGTPERRLPYYHDLFCLWMTQAFEYGEADYIEETKRKWPLIERAVMEGK